MAGGLKTGIADICNGRGVGGRPASDELRFICRFLCARKGWGLLVFGVGPIVNVPVGNAFPIRVPSDGSRLAAPANVVPDCRHARSPHFEDSKNPQGAVQT
jgi:hypothetical protein